MKVTTQEAQTALKRLSKTKDGKIVLAMLCRDCGFPNNYMDTSSMEATFALASKRGVYAKFRNFVAPEDLMTIEHGIEFVETAKKGKK